MSKVTKKDLQAHVDSLNLKYCKNTKNKFRLSQAYGGYQIVLTGKTYKRGSKLHWKKDSIGSGCADITYGHDTARNTLNEAYRLEAKGWLQSSLKHYEKNKYGKH